jgi:hypothetical protein
MKLGDVFRKKNAVADEKMEKIKESGSMRKFLLALLLLGVACAPVKAAGLTYVQSTQNGSNASSMVKPYPSNTTAGSLLICEFLIFGSSSASLVSIADTHVNAWTPISVSNPLSGLFWDIYYVQSNNSGGADTVTVTGNGSTTFVDIAIFEYTGQASPAVDVAGTPIYSTTSTTTVSFPTITTTSTNETIIAFARLSTNPNAITPGAGYTLRADDGGSTSLETEADGLFNNGSHTTSWTLPSADNNKFSTLIAFKSTSSGSPGASQIGGFIVGP